MGIFALQIRTIKEMLNWRVSLDIILITIVIFFLYQTLRATGTWKIASGILIASLIFVFARFLDLRGIDWIYSNLSQILLLALIVIFQPELRKIFERAATLKRKETTSEGSKLAFLVSDVVFSLARQKNGALIVFPGKDSIKPWTSEGIPLQAKPSYPILMSIFDTHSPGHDGAVVIENGLITSFAVRLPLSETEKLPKEFGTRHNAGMGLSEVTDTLIVVVSEERGTVTCFKEGARESMHDRNTLAASIMRHWKNTESYQLLNSYEKNQKKLLKEIALSFVLAFLFWSTVVLTQSELREVVYHVPIEYVSMPKNMRINEENPSEAQIVLLGTANDINAINPSQLKATIDLSSIKPGLNSLTIQDESISLPENIKFIRSNPSRLTFEAIKFTEIAANVKPQFIGNLPEGFSIDSIQVVPRAIPVWIPAENAKNEMNLLTTPIYLDNLKQSTTLYCNIIVPAELQLAHRQLPLVEIRIIIKKM
ncbi:diadenylate cyclase [candidate division KSB1 bacterium]|nr:diadenylate cyclase [candidate division KSB1 bacterium]